MADSVGTQDWVGDAWVEDELDVEKARREAQAARERKAARDATKLRRAELNEEVQRRLLGAANAGAAGPFNEEEEAWIKKKLAKRRVQAAALATAAEAERTAEAARVTAGIAAKANKRAAEVRADEAEKAEKAQLMQEVEEARRRQVEAQRMQKEADAQVARLTAEMERMEMGKQGPGHNTTLRPGERKWDFY